MMAFFSFCFRVTHSLDPKAFHGLFDYLEDNIIYKDKAGMWQCIRAVADIVFEKFLDRIAEKVSASWLTVVIMLTCLYV